MGKSSEGIELKPARRKEQEKTFTREMGKAAIAKRWNKEEISPGIEIPSF
jgi:hypothetical protein